MENRFKNILELRQKVMNTISKKLIEIQDLLPKKGEKFTKEKHLEIEDQVNILKSFAEATKPVLDAFKVSDKFSQDLKQAKKDFGLPEDFEEFSLLNKYEETKAIYKQSYEINSIPEERNLYLDYHINTWKARLIEKKRELQETKRENEFVPVKSSKFEIEQFRKRIEIKTENLEALIGKIDCFIEYLEILKRDAITPREFAPIEIHPTGEAENNINHNSGYLERQDKVETFESLLKDKVYSKFVIETLKARGIIDEELKWQESNNNFFSFLKVLIDNNHIKFGNRDGAKFHRIFTSLFKLELTVRTFTEYLHEDKYLFNDLDYYKPLFKPKS